MVSAGICYALTLLTIEKTFNSFFPSSLSYDLNVRSAFVAARVKPVRVVDGQWRRTFCWSEGGRECTSVRKATVSSMSALNCSRAESLGKSNSDHP